MHLFFCHEKCDGLQYGHCKLVEFIKIGGSTQKSATTDQEEHTFVLQLCHGLYHRCFQDGDGEKGNLPRPEAKGTGTETRSVFLYPLATILLKS